MPRLLALSLAFLLPVLLLLVGALPPEDSHAGKLAEDGRAATVLAVQGTALVQPAGRDRWTPLGPKSVLFPGDLVRTAARGAHALELALPTGTVLVGPGAFLQLPADGGVRLRRGEMEAAAKEGQRLVATGLGDYRLEVLGTAWLRSRDRKTVALEETPRWIQGYRASASNEWMGSLLAQVDGRDVPLAVGYHKVDVEVRDQIARTTVEQSFVNTTSARLEGVFYFPLPADASISGFGMWIGGELVEADIVERQRARQIYEDILRRKKDPGLLEWEGGNLFKARVFPILPHSEKRIRIRYTQVLPLQGASWRYRYALRSELLRTKPLRELQLTVRVSSALPLAEIGSPTHDCIVDRTKHEATIRFKASEYRPDRDFEVAVKVEGSAPVTAVPHRRGDDGYFLLMLAPPGQQDEAWQRDLVPDGEPLDLLLVADTSGSMDDAAREGQLAFLEALTSLLGEADRFRLLAFDVEPVWLVAEPTPASEEAVADALAALDERNSLGWSDLDKAFGAAFEKAGEHTVVVYVGDGVGTTGDADPVALAERLRALGRGTKATVHAVAPSSSYESGVLQALASIGGGSVRPVGARPAAAAFALMAEAARPVVRDLRVSIEGVRTARVYPPQLPNLPAGSQQIVLGRFLPEETAQEGHVVVTGTQDGKPVRFSTTLTLPAADAANDFLPRLWGRRHIDALLARGSSPEVQAEIVEFSERFGIMTPYTSFLVLESDEDRERYGVERRVKMRDGDRFFADARDKADLERRRGLMKAAGRWRLGMRRQALLEIARLARDLAAEAPPEDETIALGTELAGDGDGGFGFHAYGGGGGGFADGRARATTAHWGGDAYGAEEFEMEEDREMSRLGRRARAGSRGPPPPAPSEAAPGLREPTSPAPARKSGEVQGGPAGESIEDLDELTDFEPPTAGKPLGAGRFARGYRSDFDVPYALPPGYGGRMPGYLRRPPPPLGLESLGFPRLPDPPREDAGGEGEPWPEDVLTLLRSLLRRDAVRAAPHGLHFVLETDAVHATRGTVLHQGRLEAWIARAAWQLESASGGEPSAYWLHADEVGAYARARRLARVREAEDADANAWWLPLWDLSSRDVIRDWRRQGYRAEILEIKSRLRHVALRHGVGEHPRRILRIDPERRVVVEDESYDGDGVTTSRTRYADFVQVAGRWWARRIEFHDRRDRLVSRQRVEVEPLADGAMARAAARLAGERGEALTVEGKLPTPVQAKQAVHEKRARFPDHLALVLKHAGAQRWDRTRAAWDAARALVGEKPGRAWIHEALLALAGEGEAWKAFHGALLPERRGAAGRFLARLLVQRGRQMLGANEQAALLEAVHAAWTDAGTPAAPVRELDWRQRRAVLHFAAGEPDRGRALYAEIAEAYLHSSQAQLAHEGQLWDTGRRDEAVAHLRAVIAEREPWLGRERDSLYVRLTDRLWERRRLDDLQAATTAWLGRSPRTRTAWARWLSCHYFRGDEETADAALLAQLRAPPPAPPAPGVAPQDQEAAWARLEAAVDMALGNGWHFRLRRLHPDVTRPLADLCATLWRRDARDDGPAYRIFGDWRLRQTDVHRPLVEGLRADLAAPDAIRTMSLHRLERYVLRLGWGPSDADDAAWQRLLDGVRQRWDRAAGNRFLRPGLGALVLHLLDARGRREAAIDFVREQWRTAPERERPAHAGDLFNRLLATPVRDEHATPAREDELLSLLPALVPADASPEGARASAATNVRRLAAQVYTWRYEAGLGTPEAREPLSRAARKALRGEVREATRRAMVAFFEKAEADAQTLHRPWLRLERIGYGVEAGDGLEALVAEAAAILGADWKREENPVDRLVRERAAVAMAYAATRRNATDALRASVLATLQAGEEADAALSAKDPDAVELLDWRHHVSRLLIALDRAEALARVLEGWIVPAHVESRWRVALGYLYAETGRVADAARQFEAVRALDELSAGDYEVLADWHLVLGNDALREAALDARYDQLREWELGNVVQSHINAVRSRRGGVTGDFDPESLRALRALMRKASRPENHWSRIRNLYRATKDFRVLESIPAGLIGHSKEAVYGFLGRLSRLLGEVHEEATCDALRERLTHLRAAAKTPLDRRSLALAASVVESRASQVPETDPAHGLHAVEALREAFQEEWAKGEPRLMAAYLRALGRIKDAAAATEQLRQLDGLRRRAQRGSLEALAIARSLAGTQWLYDDREKALAVLGAALDETRAQHAGRVPESARGALDDQVRWLTELGRFGEAERILRAEIDRWDLPGRRHALHLQVFKLQVAAVRGRGTLSQGRGLALFQAAQGEMEAAMFADPARAGDVLGIFCSLHRRAKETIGTAGADLETFARERLPRLLARVPLDASNRLRTVASVVRELNGPHAGLALLLDRRDAEPRWLERIDADVWARTASDMARWRHDAGRIGTLEPRLLKLVLAELEQNLLRGGNRGSWFWSRGHKWFWSAHAKDFGDLAGRVAELHEDSETTLMRCAQLLWGPLDRYGEALQIVLAADARGQLREGNRWTLVEWLVHQSRFAEALPRTERLVEERPLNLRYRLHLAKVLHGLTRTQDARRALEETEAHFRAQERWTERVAAEMGQLAVKLAWPERAATWLEEAIRLRQEARGYRGGNDHRLASYYQQLARARGQLGQTAEAVQAAAAAYLATDSRNSSQRRAAMSALESALTRSKDLPAYVSAYEAEVERSGLDSPLIRKALATVYRSRRKDPAGALRHLLAARDLDAGDAEVHAAIVDAYDALGDAAGAIDALLRSIRLAPQNLDPYLDLAARYRKAGDAAQAERAVTSLVEASPHQAEGHLRLARFREDEQSDLPAAIVQWRQVVRTEKLDPTGWLALARVLILAGEADEARDVLGHVIAGTWEDRHGDVKKRASQMLGEIEAGSGR